MAEAAEAKVDPRPEVVLPELVLAGPLEPVRQLRAALAAAEVPAVVVPAGREALAAAAARTPSSIPRMAKFPTQPLLARNPTI